MTDAPPPTPPMEPPVRPSAQMGRTPVGRKIFFAIGLTALLLLAAEGLCRVFGFGQAAQVAPHVADWHTGYGGQTFWVFRGPGFNEDGMRDRDHAEPKPPGVHRIVCLGDSVTAGHGVRAAERWSAYLESFLQQLGLDVEVFNVAASGWSTLQELTAYRAIARRYQPDQVFLGFCLNDVAEMHNNLSAPPPAVLRWLMRCSALARWLARAEDRQIREVADLFHRPDAPAVQSGWDRVFAALESLHHETAADACGLSVLVFPFRFQLEPAAPPPLPQRKLTQWCHARGIPCMDLLPALLRLGPDAFLDESHLSPAGARLVAEEIVRWGRSGCLLCGHDLSAVTAPTCPQCAHPRQP